MSWVKALRKLGIRIAAGFILAGFNLDDAKMLSDKSGVFGMVKKGYIYSLIAGCIVALNPQLGYGTFISIDTTALTAGADYYLWFQLIDGDGSNVGNNTALIQNFNLNGGTLVTDPVIGPFTAGTYAGDLDPGSLTLTDAPNTTYFVKFQRGTALEFDLTLTTFADSPVVPDLFTLSIFNTSTNALATTANDGFGTLVFKEITGSGPISTYDISSVVPEPSVVFLFLTGGVMIIARRRAQARARIQA